MSFFLSRNPTWGRPADVRVNEPKSLTYGGSWHDRKDLPAIGVCTSGADSLGDVFRGGIHLYISEKFKCVLDQDCPDDFETYKVRIEDAAGALVSDKFYLLNTVSVEDSLDLDAMGAEMWVPPGGASRQIKRRTAIIKRADFSTARSIWRPYLMETHTVVEPSLRRALDEVGVEGAEFRQFRTHSGPVT